MSAPSTLRERAINTVLCIFHRYCPLPHATPSFCRITDWSRTSEITLCAWTWLGAKSRDWTFHFSWSSPRTRRWRRKIVRDRLWQRGVIFALRPATAGPSCACGILWTCAQPPRCRLKITAETIVSHVIGKFDFIYVYVNVLAKLSSSLFMNWQN